MTGHSIDRPEGEFLDRKLEGAESMERQRCSSAERNPGATPASRRIAGHSLPLLPLLLSAHSKLLYATRSVPFTEC